MCVPRTPPEGMGERVAPDLRRHNMTHPVETTRKLLEAAARIAGDPTHALGVVAILLALAVLVGAIAA